jgi:hypothetical protein
MQFARNNHICGGVYGIKDSQLGDGPMNLPLELQRRLDRRWSARFAMSDKVPAPPAVRLWSERWSRLRHLPLIFGLDIRCLMRVRVRHRARLVNL